MVELFWEVFKLPLQHRPLIDPTNFCLLKVITDLLECLGRDLIIVLRVEERTIVAATLSAFASKVGTKFLIHSRGEDRALRVRVLQVENPKLCTILDCFGLPTAFLSWGRSPTIGGVVAPTIGRTVGSTRTRGSVRLLIMSSRRRLDSTRSRLRCSRQDAVANCNRGTLKFLDILQQLEGLDDRRDVEVSQRTVASYNIDIGEESCRVEEVDKYFFD